MLIADADFIKDQLAYSTISQTGNVALSKARNNNVSLLLNCLEQVRGNHDLLAIRPQEHTPSARLSACNG